MKIATKDSNKGGLDMFDMSKICSYVCDRYYQVIYKGDYYLTEQAVSGFLVNYTGSIVLLSEKGIYHIGYKDIVFMKPINVPRNKLSKEFLDLIDSLQGTGTKEGQ